MSHDAYTGVYSSRGAGTSIGTELSFHDNKLFKVKSKSKDRQYQTISKSTLESADLNVAKIRLVTTLPGKEIPEELRGKAYVGFVLTGVQETHNEKVEIIPLPGDTFASYFYGASPRQFNFSGILLNTDQDQWRDAFEDLYENYLRGSVSSRNFSIVQISYSGRIVSGWLTNLTQQLDSSNDHYSSFSFSVLVSRIDMVGGSKKFSNYLVKLDDDGGEFANSKIDADYAILDPTNYNGMIDPVRTGMVIPPKRPHKKRSKKVTPSCWFPATVTDAGKPINNGAATANNHINDATKCSVIEAIEGSNRLIDQSMKEAKKLLSTENGNVPTKEDIEKAKALEAKAKAQSLAIKREISKKEVRDQLQQESKALVQYYKDAAKVEDGKKPTARQLRAQKALREGIKVGKATLVVTDVDNNSGQVRFDPDIDDGTVNSAGARKARGELFTGGETDSEGNQVALGLGDKALDARRRKDAEIADKRKKDAATASARAAAKRSGLDA